MVKQILRFIVCGLLLTSFDIPAGTLTAMEATTASDDEARAFLARWLELSQDNNDFDAVMTMYADTVDFYKLGRVKKEAVAADKKKYFDRWPQREHRLISFNVRPGATDNVKEVSLSFHYRIRNARGAVKESDANAALLLRRAKNTFVIVSEQEATMTARQADDAVITDSGKEATTRAGKVTISENADRTGLMDILYLNGKKIYKGPSLEIVKILNRKNAHFVLVASFSGGIACPATAVILELQGAKNYRLSEEFGSCSDIMKARLEEDSVVVEMPVYTGHPEFLDEEGRKNLNAVKDVFVWKNGKLTKSSTGGLDFRRCFPQTSAGTDQVLQELLAESKKRGGKDVHKVKPEQHDLNKDGHPDWFIATDICSAAVGCFGDVYLYYEKSEVCPGRGFCYAGSNYNKLLAAPDMQLKCEASYRDLSE